MIIDTWAGYARACATQTPVVIRGRRYRVTGLGTCPTGSCTAGPDCPGLLYLHTFDTGPVTLALPAVHLTTGAAGPGEQYRLDIITDPDPAAPTAAVVVYQADGIAAALGQARRLLVAHDGPDDQYGELYQREGEHPGLHLTTVHRGA